MVGKIIKWLAVGLLSVVVGVFVLLSSPLLPWFWEVAYSGDGEYDVEVFYPAMYGFNLRFPEFRLDEESTRTYEIERFMADGSPFFELWVESNEPVPFALLDTLVTVSLRNSAGDLIYEVSANLSSHNSVCGMTEPQQREWDKSNPVVWFESPCADLGTDKVMKSQTRFFDLGSYGEPVLSWWEDYELVLSVREPDQSHRGITAHLEISKGPK